MGQLCTAIHMVATIHHAHLCNGSCDIHTLSSHTIIQACIPRADLQEHDEVQSEISKKAKMDSMLDKMEQIRAGKLNPAELTTEENRCLWQRLKTALGQHNPAAEKASAMWSEINASGAGKDAKKKMLLQAWPWSQLF